MTIESVNPHALAAFEDLNGCIGLDPSDLGGTVRRIDGPGTAIEIVFPAS